MAQPSDAFKLRKAFFHILGKANTESTQNVYESKYKSLGNVTSKDVWLQNVGFAPDIAAADSFTLNNPGTVKKYENIHLTPVPGSNYQTYYLSQNGVWVRPWINPVDVPNPITNEPSNGYSASLFTYLGTLISPTLGRWVIDYYAGTVYFQEGYTPIDLYWGKPLGPFGDNQESPKITCYAYVGQTLGNLDYSGAWEIEREIIELSSGDIQNKYFSLQYAFNNHKDVTLNIIGAPQQIAGIDYDISGVNNIVWSQDSDMGNNLEHGDIVEVKYSKLS